MEKYGTQSNRERPEEIQREPKFQEIAASLRSSQRCESPWPYGPSPFNKGDF